MSYDREMERIRATQPGYVPVSQRPRRKVTHVRTYRVGVEPCSAQWSKVGTPFRDDDGDMVQNWFCEEYL